jgi:hypothetical protein
MVEDQEAAFPMVFWGVGLLLFRCFSGLFEKIVLNASVQNNGYKFVTEPGQELQRPSNRPIQCPAVLLGWAGWYLSG